jgi:hypothetical protein
MKEFSDPGRDKFQSISTQTNPQKKGLIPIFALLNFNTT